MIPISSSNYQQGCDPISSNCVTWQGPNISCINLCKGDTVSDVVSKLATELCEIQTSLDISGISLSCLELTTAPTDTNELFQVLVNQICSLDGRVDTLEGGSGSSGSSSTTEGTLPTCLQYTNAQNDLVTTLPIDEYAELVAARVCTIITDVTTLQTQIADHETRITTLEGSTVTQYTTPQITPTCVLPSTPTNIDVVLDELEDQFCTLNTTLGGSTSLLASATYQCDLLASDDRLAGSGTMSQMEGWNAPVANTAESLTNMWLTICDMRAAIKDIQQNCCTVTCSDIIFTAFGSFANNVITLNFGGTIIPSGFTECNTAGATVTVMDAAANTYSTTISVLSALQGNDTADIDIEGSQLSEVSNYTVTIALCVGNGTITCDKTLSFEVTNDASSCAVPSGITATIS